MRADNIGRRRGGRGCRRIPQSSSFLPLSREGWASYGLIGREIISDAILARTQPRCRVITVKALLPFPQLSILPSSTCPTAVSPFNPFPSTLSLNRRNHRAPNHCVYYRGWACICRFCAFQPITMYSRCIQRD